MCGILAVFQETADVPVNKADVAERLERLHHRGPDESGIEVWDGRAVLGHKRLSIVDLDHGRQPLRSKDDNIVLICNGEIYNHGDVRKRLAGETGSDGLQTRSDSEVIIALYERYGTECVKHLDGMYAFVLLDKKNGLLLAARDPIGIKPLYVGRDKDGRTWFSSEMKGIVDVCPHMEALPPGHYVTAGGEPKPFFSPSWAPEEHKATNEFNKNKLHDLLTRAVEKRLMADVPVGVFVSGGLDSSLTAAIARKLLPKDQPLHSFSCGFAGERESEDLRCARIVAKHLGTQHHERVFTFEEGIKAVEKVIYHLETYDPAMIRSGCGMYLLCSVVAGQVKVALCGEGADEVFAGYLYFRETDDPHKVQKECVKKIKNLHRVQLQFQDRLAMAHSVEVRVPFLDTELLEHALNVDTRVKLHDHENERPEKWMLRTAFEGYLPDEVLWRQKEQFGDGLGYDWIDGLRAHLAETISDEEFASAAEQFPINTPATKEDYYYRKVFSQFFPTDSASSAIEAWSPWSRPDLKRDSSARLYAPEYHGSASR